MVSLVPGHSWGWSLSLKAPGERPEAASGEALSSGWGLNGLSDLPAEGAHGVTGGIFCPFSLKYGRPNAAAGFLQGLGGEDPPAAGDSACRGRGGRAAPAQLLPGSGQAGLWHQAQPRAPGVRAARLWGCWKYPSSQDVGILVVQPAWSRNSWLPSHGWGNQSLQLAGTRAVKSGDGESDPGPAELTFPSAGLAAVPWGGKEGQLIPQAAPAVPSTASL